jgi:hypothetical protein
MKGMIDARLDFWRVDHSNPIVGKIGEGQNIRLKPTGAFLIEPRGEPIHLIIVSTQNDGWDHVSVSMRDRGHDAIPSWEQMCVVKDQFFEPEEVVMQLHPRRSQYVNICEWCLHLWRPHAPLAIPEPPRWLVT